MLQTRIVLCYTNNLIPREYFMEIKGTKHNEEITYPNEIKFEIISEK